MNITSGYLRGVAASRRLLPATAVAGALVLGAPVLGACGSSSSGSASASGSGSAAKTSPLGKPVRVGSFEIVVAETARYAHVNGPKFVEADITVRNVSDAESPLPIFVLRCGSTSIEPDQNESNYPASLSAGGDDRGEVVFPRPAECENPQVTATAGNETVAWPVPAQS